MDWRLTFFILATSILWCAGRGYAKAPRPYKGNFADSSKYVDPTILEERMVDTRDAGNLNHIEDQG